MEVICDLHIHSRYSGGSSKYITLRKIANNCKIKGIDIVGSGDALNPIWLKELKSNLQEYSDGIYFLPYIPEVKFILQTEVEIIWKLKNQTRKVHFILL
ncbi:MAG: DNA helicase UvrD, partial [Promethearchaeota archaeon]